MSATKRRIIQLLPHEHNLLRDLVDTEKVPDGQFIRRWDWWRQLVGTFNELTERSFKPEELHHYVMTLRKRPIGRSPRWEPMGDGCAHMPGSVYSSLSDEDRRHLVAVYTSLATRLGAGSDSILVDAKNRKELAAMFAAAAGHGINDRSLIAAVIDLRKDKAYLKAEDQLPRLGQIVRSKKQRRKFNDFDQAEAM
jgi:hypothetical protein